MATCEARNKPAAPPPSPPATNQPGFSLLKQKQNEKEKALKRPKSNSHQEGEFPATLRPAVSTHQLAPRPAAEPAKNHISDNANRAFPCFSSALLSLGEKKPPAGVIFQIRQVFLKLCESCASDRRR